jgi:hypothetical protein
VASADRSFSNFVVAEHGWAGRYGFHVNSERQDADARVAFEAWHARPPG